MAMEHPHWAANIRGALMLPPPPGYVPPQQVIFLQVLAYRDCYPFLR